jgi:hypothetical protein
LGKIARQNSSLFIHWQLGIFPAAEELREARWAERFSEGEDSSGLLSNFIVFLTLGVKLVRMQITGGNIDDRSSIMSLVKMILFLRTLYLTIDYITRKWSISIQNWGETMVHFLIKFEGKI